MAIDTETKRRSMLGRSLMFLVIAPVPDGTLSSVDRLHIIGFPGTIAPATALTAVNIIGDLSAVPNHVADSIENTLFTGFIEVWDGIYVGGLTSYLHIDSTGKLDMNGNRIDNISDLTLHNSTHEDSDGGRESRINFKGEQGVDPFEETTLARIEVSHDGSGADDKGKIVISTNDGDDADTPTDRMTILANGNVGIGTTDPGYILDVHGDIGFETTGAGAFVNFIRSGTTGGTVDLSGGDFRLTASTNNLILRTDADEDVILDTRNVGIGTTTPTTKLSVNEKTGMTTIGGGCIKLTNKTGGNTVAGQLVLASTGTDDAFETAGANADNTIGIVLDAGIADGSEAWVVESGIADVLIDAGGCTHGDRMISSATAGSADVWNVGGAVATHFQEIGHCLETRVGAGLARVNIHFN